MAKLSFKKAVWLTKTTAKAVVRITKITITAAKAFIAFLIEGGWVPLTVILSILLIICMICSFGTVFGDNDVTPESDIQVVAYSQIGNIGGVPYWSWYGYSNRVEWCACFVSWCANQCGYIKNNTFPKYAACIDGVKWFKKENQWIDGNVIPISGMIIFFDWEQDGLPDHIDSVGAMELKERYPDNTVLVYIAADIKTMQQRLERREPVSTNDTERRKHDRHHQLMAAFEYDYIVFNNGNLMDAVEAFSAIILAQRNRRTLPCNMNKMREIINGLDTLN